MKQNNTIADTTVATDILQAELKWLKDCLSLRLNSFFKGESEKTVLPGAPSLDSAPDPYADFITSAKLSDSERLIVILALSPHLFPGFLDVIFNKHIQKPGDFPRFGGLRGKNFRGLMPTCETAIFLLAGTDMNARLDAINLLNKENGVVKKGIVQIDNPPRHEPFLNGVLYVNTETFDLLVYGRSHRPMFSEEFPAMRINTRLEWEDLVLKFTTLHQIRELQQWIDHHKIMLHEWGLADRIAPGYKALFYGPPGTGKTLTASLLGKYTGKEVYRIDLSLVVSKFIGETEKNLSRLFDKAENKEWILFFDEADALFGSRTDIRDAHDKYANQEVSYLLQRIEVFPGLVILATNFKSNIDEAFLRRFQSVIHFPMPGPAERLALWKKAFPGKVELERKIDLERLAAESEISGAGIMNVIQYSCLKALNRGTNKILRNDISEGIKKEYAKEGKML